MAGTIHGSVDHVIDASIAASSNQELFTWLYKFFVDVMIANGYATMIATQYGTAGAGFDYFDEAAPSGENAFFLVRMNVSTERPGTPGTMGAYYILVQWADANLFGAAPGNPGKISNTTTDGVAIVAAFREDGTSPWAGTTLNNGADTKGATVWTAGGSTLHVLERSCSAGGANAVTKENMFRILDATDIARVHMLGDEDSIIILVDPTNSGAYQFVYIGPYDSLDDLAITYPMAFIGSTIPLSGGTIYGTTSGSTTTEGTMVTSDFYGKADVMLAVDWPIVNTTIAENQPNPQADPSSFDELDIMLFSKDGTSLKYGLAGHFQLLKVCYKVASNSCNRDMSRAAFGATDTAGTQLTVPWSTTTLPAATSSRAGTQF